MAVAPFTRTLVVPRPAEIVVAELEDELSRPLRGWGYRPIDKGPWGLHYRRTGRPWDTWLAGLLLLPGLIGILVLVFWTETEDIRIRVEPHAGGAKVDVEGEGPRKVRAAFADLRP